MIYLLIILMVIFGVTDHEKDQIAHQKNNTLLQKIVTEKFWNKIKLWYTTNLWQTQNWWLKNPLAMFLDGWHCVKTFNMWAGYGMGSIALINVLRPLGSPWWYYIILTLALYIVGGGLHSWANGTLLRTYPELTKIHNENTEEGA